MSDLMSISDWRINFFDLGAWPGHETAAFLEAADSLREGRAAPVVAAYLYEAHPIHAKELRARFDSDPRIFVFESAIGSADASTKLWETALPEGNSLYREKSDAGTNTVEVCERLFSSILADAQLDHRNEKTVNIIKANIEGAEWDLIQDLEANDLWSLFDLYLGSDQWTMDMGKCHSLLPFIANARNMLDRRGISVKSFCLGTKNYPAAKDNVDLKEEIRRLIVEKGSLVKA